MKYLTYDSLKRINASSVKAGRNRNLYFDRLPIDPVLKYPVVFDFIHNEREIRTRIVLNQKGESVWLDMSFEEFDGLPSQEVPADVKVAGE